MRVGGVLVPLSTLLRPPELAAQLRTAAVTHLVVVREYRGRRYLADLEGIAPGITTTVGSATRHPALPALRHLQERELAMKPRCLPTKKSERCVKELEVGCKPTSIIAEAD